MMKILSDLKNMFLDILYPNGIKCICCDKELDHESSYCMCDECIKNLPIIPLENRCAICGSQLTDMKSICDDCKYDKFEFSYCKSIFRYEEPIDRLIKSYKYENGLYLQPYLSNLINDYMEPISNMIDFIIPIPIHYERMQERGFNQCEELLKNLSPQYLKKINTNIIIRRINNQKQSALNGNDRKNNVVGIFNIIDFEIVKNKNILLFDDVITTGSTISECARILKKAGANKIFAMTFANARNRKISK